MSSGWARLGLLMHVSGCPGAGGRGRFPDVGFAGIIILLFRAMAKLYEKSWWGAFEIRFVALWGAGGVVLISAGLTLLFCWGELCFEVHRILLMVLGEGGGSGREVWALFNVPFYKRLYCASEQVVYLCVGRLTIANFTVNFAGLSINTIRE